MTVYFLKSLHAGCVLKHLKIKFSLFHPSKLSSPNWRDLHTYPKASSRVSKSSNSSSSPTLTLNLLPETERSSLSPQSEDTGGMHSRSSSLKIITSSSTTEKERAVSVNHPPVQESELFTRECQQDLSSQSSSIRLTISEIDTQIMKLSQILDRDSTTRDQGSKPFWNTQSKEISKKLWLPTQTDSLDLGSNSSGNFLRGSRTGESWFPRVEINSSPQKKNSVRISSPSSRFTLPKFTGEEATSSEDPTQPQNGKPEKLYRTRSVRLFPSKTPGITGGGGRRGRKMEKTIISSESTRLRSDMGFFRWYCNFTRDVLTTVYNDYGKKVFELDKEFLGKEANFEKIVTEHEEEIEKIKKKHAKELVEAPRRRGTKTSALKKKQTQELDEIRQRHWNALATLRANLKLKKKTVEYEKRLGLIQKDDLFCKMTSWKKGKCLSYTKVRDLFMFITITGTKVNEKTSQTVNEIQYNPFYKSGLCNPHWVLQDSKGGEDAKSKGRIKRGAIKLMTANFQASLTNFLNKRISHFDFSRHLSKKDFNLLHFEDDNLPEYIKEIKRKGGARVNFKKGCTIKYYPKEDKYILFFPKAFEPKTKKNSPLRRGHVDLDNHTITAIDEGIVNTHTLYTHNKGNRGVNNTVEIYAYSRSPKFERRLKRSDELRSKLQLFKDKNAPKRKIEGVRRCLLKTNAKIHNSIQHANKKLASKIAKENDHVILPPFLVSEIAKRTNLQSSHRRLLYTWQFNHFKEFLKYKCRCEGAHFYEVSEEFTSKTCGNCGKHTTLTPSQDKYRVMECDNCHFSIDRDVNGARNILIKFLSS